MEWLPFHEKQHTIIHKTFFSAIPTPNLPIFCAIKSRQRWRSLGQVMTMNVDLPWNISFKNSSAMLFCLLHSSTLLYYESDLMRYEEMFLKPNSSTKESIGPPWLRLSQHTPTPERTPRWRWYAVKWCLVMWGLFSAMIIITIAVISIVLYLTDRGEHTALCKINRNVYIKTSKIIIT